MILSDKTMKCSTKGGAQMVFLFPGSWALGWSPAPALAPTSGPSVQFVYTALACICIYRQWLPICILPVLASSLICIYRPWLPNLHLPVLAQICIYQVKILLLLPQPLVLSRTATTTTSTTTTTIATTATTTNNNKRYLHGSKIRIKWPLECIWWKCCVLFQ